MDRTMGRTRKFAQGVPVVPTANSLSFQRLFEKMRGVICGFFGKRHLQAADVENCYSECGLRYFAAQKRERIKSPQAYFWKIARNVLHEFHRDHRRAPASLPSEGVCEDLRLWEAGGLPGLGEIPEELAPALTDLSPQEREVLLLSLTEGLAAADIAATLNTTPGAVRKSKCHAIRKVQRHVSAQLARMDA